MKRILGVLAVIFVAACSSTGIVPLDDGVYMISKRRVQVGISTPEGVKAEVYREANAFCAEKNLVVETIKFEVTDPEFAESGRVYLEFRCKEKSGKLLDWLKF